MAIFWGAPLASLQAMPPKPLWKGKGSEKAQIEEQEAKRLVAEDLENQGRRLTDDVTEDFSSNEERGDMMSGREDLSFSADKLDRSFLFINQASEELKAVLSTVNVESLDNESLRIESLKVEEQIHYWVKQKKNGTDLLRTSLESGERSSLEEDQKLRSLVSKCREIWLGWDDLFSKLQDEIEKREIGLTTDEDDNSSVASSVSSIIKPMASLKLADALTAPPGGGVVGMSAASAVTASSSFMSNSLKDRLETFLATSHVSSSLIDSQLSVTQAHQQEIRKKIRTLLQQAKGEVELNSEFIEELERKKTNFRNTIKRKWEDIAARWCSYADQSYAQARIPESCQHYHNAIRIAEEAVQIWSETEMFYTRLRDAVGGKIRRLGMRIKPRLKQSVRDWEAKLNQIELELELLSKKKELKKNIEEAVECRRLADQEERNEIGETWDAIARRLKVIQNHLGKVQEAYGQGDEATVKNFEQKIFALEARNESARQHLSSLESAMAAWKRDYSTEASRYLESREEVQSDSTKKISLIYKRRFVGPLLRIERTTAANGEILREIKMAAEYLMVKLNSSIQRATLLESLKEDFPNNHLTLESVAPEQYLYRLNFKSAASALAAADQPPLLTLFDQIKKAIEEKSLAADCYPSTLIELASSKISETARTEITQPWYLHSLFGVNPPDTLFNTEEPIVAEGTPIRIGVVDSGIRESHQAFENKIVVEEDEDEEVSYGYNACAIHPDYRGLPRDNTGHGTHVAGIIVGLPHEVEEVEVKKKKNSEQEPTVFELNEITRATIRGIASVRDIAALLICKNMEPGQTEGFVDRTLECLRYAREQGARIINCSWGGSRDDEGELSQKNLESLKQALSNPYEILRKEGQGEWSSYDPQQFAPPVLAVMAAGNLRKGQDTEKLNKDKWPSYPASFSLPNGIAVAATNPKGNLADFSYYGIQSIQIAAPGTGIISASFAGDAVYRKLAGTSMAAPQVAAAAAWVMRKFNNLSPQKIVEHLEETANKEDPTIAVASGRLDLARALSKEPTCLKTKEKIDTEETEKLLEEAKRLSLEKKMEKQKKQSMRQQQTECKG